ncbi:MAG: ribonuclease H-like domain-containing protein [Candidatus Doudnabacteria bacterium]|nr:ribonuclease H-like domain-containing protein [Candidatus Doudnabacteria bacterium]
MLKKIVLDLETQKLFEEVGGRGKNHLLKISVAGIYDYSSDRYQVFREHEIPKLASILQTADQVIGYNIKDFDFEVLRPYLNFDIHQVPYLDLLEEIEKVLYHRIKLDDVAKGTLGSGKTGSGKEAILYFRQGRWDNLEKYCLDDVKITKQIYDYALKNKKLLYKDFFKTKEMPIKIAEAVPRVGVMHQTALF